MKTNNGGSHAVNEQRNVTEGNPKKDDVSTVSVPAEGVSSRSNYCPSTKATRTSDLLHPQPLVVGTSATYMEHLTDLSRVHTGHLKSVGSERSTFFMMTFVVFFLPPMFAAKKNETGHHTSPTEEKEKEKNRATKISQIYHSHNLAAKSDESRGCSLQLDRQTKSYEQKKGNYDN